MEQYARGAVAPAARQPICRIADDHDGWGDNFLAPILQSAGYRVVAETSGETADVMLCLTDEGAARAGDGDVPVIRLRASAAAAGPDDETVYRYDRGALLDALRRRIGGAGA